MARCFLIEPAHYDLTQLRKDYGEVYYTFDRDTRPSIFDPAKFERELSRKFAAMNFDPLSDYIVLTGKLITVSIALATLARRHPQINVLMFSAQSNTYVERII